MFLTLSLHPSDDHGTRVSRRGGLLLEAVLSIAILSLFLSGIALSMVLGERSTISGGDRVRAVFIAERNLEGVRYIRDENFSAVGSGSFSVEFAVPDGWLLHTGSTLTTEDGYETWVDITQASDELWEVASHVEWDFGNTRSGSIVLNTYLSNWRKTLEIGNWSSVSLIAQDTIGVSAGLDTIAVSGDYAYIGGLSGTGLYIYDISDPASPVRVATDFALNSTVYDIAIDGSKMYLATNDAAAELQSFDISNPATLSLANLSGSYNVTGVNLLRTIEVFNNTVYAGLTDDPAVEEFRTYDISSTGAFLFLDSLETGGVTDISLREGYAYLSSSYDSIELQVVDVFDPTDLVYAPGTGMDFDDVQDASLVATFGTSAIIGRVGGSAIDEIILYSVASSPVPSPPPGPWSQDLGGDANAFAYEPSGVYGFVVGSDAEAQLRVLNIPEFSSGLNPIETAYDLGATGYGVVYDWQQDRLYVITQTSLFIFAPSS